MTTTADYILSLAETVAQDFGNHGDATESYAALRTAVESLVAERDALKAAAETASIVLSDLQGVTQQGSRVRGAWEQCRAALRGQP